MLIQLSHFKFTRVHQALLLIITLISTFTQLQGVEAHPQTSYRPAKTTQSKSHLSDDPMYFLSRYSLVVPDNATEMVTTASVGFGVFSENQRHAFGIRFSWLPNPPENPLADENASYIRMNNAFGPLFDWRFFINPNSRMTFYTVASAGFVFGSPNQKSKDLAKNDDSLAEATNQVLPVFECGLGVVFSKKLGAENEFFLNPEFGIVPGLTAPYISISAGFNL